MASFSRGKNIDIKSLRNTTTNTAIEARLRNQLRKSESLIQNAAEDAELHANFGGITGVGGIELEKDESFKYLTQKDLLKDADLLTQEKRFTLSNLPGKYNVRYSPTGKLLMLQSTNGHFATFDWQAKDLYAEFDIREKVNDSCWLHQEEFFAAAQSKWTRVYESESSREIHCIHQFHKIKHLDFLPFHFLLVGAAERYKLHYLDISVGKMVASCSTETNCRINTMKKSKANAVMHLGLQDGTVQLFTPNFLKGPVVKFLALKQPCTSIAITDNGRYIACSGVGRKINIFDLRNAYKPVYSHSNLQSGALNLTFSQNDILAASYGNNDVITYQNITTSKHPNVYVKYNPKESIQSVDFCPYEDILGIGYSRGFDSVLVPGSGKSQIDSYENNPFRNKKQKDNWEMSRLLDKIPSKMICLDNNELKRVKEVFVLLKNLCVFWLKSEFF